MPVSYRELRLELSGLLENSFWLTNLANMSALIMSQVPRLNWCGFYLVHEGELKLGPFQGMPACLTIPIGKGVCGAAAERRTSVVVPDVHKFPGHIACDSRSNSEIVVPVIVGSRLIGVLDLDSPEFNRFDETDRAGLESLVAELVTRTKWPPTFG
jgi:L-methionine (R)-S-oxide reductase